MTNEADLRNKYGDKTVGALLDILNHAADAERLLASRAEPTDRLDDLACEAIIIHIGESATRTSIQFRADHPELELNDAISIRHITAHGYDIVDYPTLWDTLQYDIPRVIQRIRKILLENAE